ncbi:MAG: helix-turn-helix domain-containing protein [Lachnospiraceae bacterium]
MDNKQSTRKTKFSVAIGDRLRKHREDAQMTQEQVAELIGVSSRYYRYLEEGERKPSMEKLLLIREKMSMDLNYLVAGETEKGEEEGLI